MSANEALLPDESNPSLVGKAQPRNIGGDDDSVVDVAVSVERRGVPDGKHETISAMTVAAKVVVKGSKKGVFYRGDNRPPSEIFKKGFTTQGSNMNLITHLSFGGESGYVSVSRSRDAAARYAFGRTEAKTETGYIYYLAPHNMPDGYWIPEMYKDNAVHANQEFAAAASIPPETIQGVRVIHKAKPLKEVKWIDNPKFAFKGAVCNIRKRSLCIPPATEDEHINSKPPSEEGPMRNPKPPSEQSPKGKSKPPSQLNHSESQMKALAEQFGEKRLKKLAGQKGLDKIAEKRLKMPFSEVRPRILIPKGLALSETLKGGALKGLNAVGYAFWVNDMVEAFSTESSGLEKAAAVTAIIPFVGCGFNTAVQQEHHEDVDVSAVDTALCVIGDALLLGKVTAPAGIVVHLSRSLLPFKLPELPTFDEVRSMRDKPWDDFIHKDIFESFMSESWLMKLESAMAIEALTIVNRAADTIGIIEAGSQIVLEGNQNDDRNGSEVEDGKPEGSQQQDDKSVTRDENQRLDTCQVQNYTRDVAQAKNNTQTATSQVLEKMDAEIISRQRQYLLGPRMMLHSLEQSIKDTSKEYNKGFIQRLNSDEVVKSYPSPKRYPYIFQNDRELYGRTRGRFLHISNNLDGWPPQSPNLYTLAYFIGVMAGVDGDQPQKSTRRDAPESAAISAPTKPDQWKQGISPGVIDPILYYKEKAKREDRQAVVQHTLAIVKLLEGKIQESKLPRIKSGMGLPGASLPEFHQLIAMFVGYKFANWKKKQGSRDGYIDTKFSEDNALIEHLYGASKDDNEFIKDFYAVLEKEPPKQHVSKDYCVGVVSTLVHQYIAPEIRQSKVSAGMSASALLP
ncbi:pertussis toxin, subunit 1 domain-containing protein [Hirsutella rhossiliensis]|uniref:Pertussis toxin, subunit 1 domain-containing protein n=1 Tax=Hirsutella rhossiliensis TaxID=111463 RepID=A0A9P8MWJ8_9HYPO|nr:pertussis toxin, subunit 1 domain-containing protein [Hirsutella rhossiliensis]KAH0962347.1 pertussis toxin, subunit 1 domain-containing protein [Hirsutella rhossiliensis]